MQLFPLPQELRWYAPNDGKFGDILSHDCPHSDLSPCPDRHSWKNHAMVPIQTSSPMVTGAGSGSPGERFSHRGLLDPAKKVPAESKTDSMDLPKHVLCTNSLPSNVTLFCHYPYMTSNRHKLSRMPKRKSKLWGRL
jgi:hypothetical protein